MADAIWIDRDESLAQLARMLEQQSSIGLDTEFLRERTFFPKLCLMQFAAAGEVWCVDPLEVGNLEPLVEALTAAGSRKIVHAARQDLEAFYLNVKRVISPVFDTQIAAGCIGLKPQIGYADLVKTLLNVTVPKGQTRTDWSRRPLSAAQLEYAADDVKYLHEVAAKLTERLRALGREHWVTEDCLALEDPRWYEPDPRQAWKRLRNLGLLPREARARGRAAAAWREAVARERDLPRGWILADAAIFSIAAAGPANREELDAALRLDKPMKESLAESLLEALRESAGAAPEDPEPHRDLRPTPEQKALMERLARIVDGRAQELGVSAEILAPRGELKALAMGARNVQSLSGWRRGEIGERLLAALQ
ncbi:MAG TPA: ribonuclease D [Steroidobacteraceae bacterium]|jgi:ribonuclease D|nr:ribonuclease D [Steroidobacteraceae bacterium]